MTTATILPDLNKAIENFLSVPTSDPRFVPVAEELAKALRTASFESEDLRRYRETRERMGPAQKTIVCPPNFPYTVQSA